MSPVSKYQLVMIIVTLLIVFESEEIKADKRRPLNRILGALEYFWQLGWKGFKNFPLNFHQLKGVHVNHHQWREFGPLPAGLPIEGILERKDHPFHQWMKRMYPNGVVATHLNDYNRGGVPPSSASYHAFIQDRGLYNYNSLMSSPSSFDSISLASNPLMSRSELINDQLMSPPFLINPFATPEQASQEIPSPPMDIMNLQPSSPLVTSSSALSSAINRFPWSEGLIVRHPFPFLPVFAPEKVLNTGPSFNSWHGTQGKGTSNKNGETNDERLHSQLKHSRGKEATGENDENDDTDAASTRTSRHDEGEEDETSYMRMAHPFDM